MTQGTFDYELFRTVVAEFLARHPDNLERLRTRFASGLGLPKSTYRKMAAGTARPAPPLARQILRFIGSGK